MKQLFLVHGIGRSGTTAMCKTLNLVPEIACVYENGQRVWDYCTDKLDEHRIFFPEKIPEILEIIAKEQNPDKDMNNVQAIGIKIPFPDNVLSLFIHCPNIRFICLTRHPLDLFLSQHNCEVTDFNKGWPSHIYSFDKGRHRANILNNYWAMVKNLSNKQIIKFESFFTDPRSMKSIFDFIGVNLHIRCCKDLIDQSMSLRQSSMGGRPEGDINPFLGCTESKRREAYKYIIPFYNDLIESKCWDTFVDMKYI